MTLSSHSILPDLLRLTLASPFIFVLPGYFALRLAARVSLSAQTSQHGRLGILEESFFSVVLSLTLTSWLALLLAEVGYFSVDLLIGALALVCLGLWLLSRRKSLGTPSPRPPSSKSVWALAGLVCLAAILFTPPFQTTLWGSDSTAYVNFGRQIGESGAFVFADDLLDGMPQAAREELFRNRMPRDLTGEYARFPGGFSIPDIADTKVAAGFSPLFPTWVALFDQLLGLPMVFLLSSLFGILSLCSVFFVGTHLQGTKAGFFAGLLLSACLPQIWFARASMSEVMSQFFVFAGLLALLYYLETEAAFSAATAGVVLGMALFARFDLIPILTLSIAVASAYLLFTRTRIAHYRYFLAGFGTLLLHCLAHLAFFPSNYDQFIQGRLDPLLERVGFSSPFDQDPHSVFLLLLLGSLLLVVGMALLISRIRVLRKPRLLAGVLSAGLVLYAVTYVSVTVSRLSQTVGWLAWYLTWPLLAAFAVGLTVLFTVKVIRQGDLTILAVSILLAVACLHYLYNPLDLELGNHIWTMRRFVPVVIPGILLMFSVSVVFVLERVSQRYSRWLIPVVLLPFFALVLRPSLAIINEPLWPDGIRESRDLADQFPEDSVLLVGRELAGTHVQMTLSYLHERDGLLLQQQFPDSQILRDQISAWLQRGREVFFLVTQGDTHFYAPKLELRPYLSRRLDLAVLETTRTGVPQEIVSQSVEMRAFRAQPYEQGPKSSIDVGNYAVDALFVLRGFYGPEKIDAAQPSFRWTSESASIDVPESTNITLLLDGGRPRGVHAAKIWLWVDDRLVLEGRVIPNTPTEVTVSVPVVSIGDSGGEGPRLISVRLTSNTFNPKDLGISDDDRNLGVRVYRVEFE